MHHHNITPETSLPEDQGKDTTLDAIQPNFDDTIFTPSELGDHLKELLKEAVPLLHGELLKKLLEQVQIVDFRAAGNIPEDEKVKQSQLHVLVIEEVQRLADINSWGLCQKNGAIYLFNASYWSELNKDELRNFLGNAAEKMGVDRLQARHHSFKDQLFKQFLSAGFLEPAPAQNGVFVNLQNGTFEVTDQGGLLREFRREDFLTFQLPFFYDHNADAPMFHKYLNQVLPDIECQKVLAEYLAYVFTPFGQFKLEKVLLLYGTGANGKSVFFDIVNAMMGQQNLSTFSLQNLTDDSGYYRAKLGTKLINYASEINGLSETSVFKQIASGEPIEARLPYGEPFMLSQYAKLVFNCNELPKEVENSHAYFRRFLIIPFKITILEEDQDKELAKKIINKELSGVFNWILEGLQRLLARKDFTPCEASRMEVEQYRKQSDSVKLFLDENDYVSSPSKYILDKILYGEYRIFCQDDGYKPVSKINFKKRLESARILVERKNIGFVAFVEKGQ